MSERGKYIVIEGHDATGKSTQVSLVQTRLAERGIQSLVMQEPEGLFDRSGENITPMAAHIRTLLKNGSIDRYAATDIALFSAARAEMWPTARQRIEQGLWVVAARNYFSTLAYQCHAAGQSEQQVLAATHLFTDELYMNPDLAVVLTMNDETTRNQRIAQRGPLENPDTFEMRDAAFQARVHDGYHKLAKSYDLPTVDASATPDEVTGTLMRLVDTRLF